MPKGGNQMHKRMVRYTNAYGEQLIFDNKVLFCEEMHIGAAQAKFNAQPRAFDDGQYSSDYKTEPLPLSFRFALRDRENNEFLRNKVVDVFTSTKPGTITVYTENEKYTIQAHLVARPDFQRVGSRIYRWEASFVADFPYWKKGSVMLEKELTVREGDTGASGVISSRSPVPVPVVIEIEGVGSVFVYINGKYIYIDIPANANLPISIDTENFKVKDANGQNKNNYIASGREIGDLYLEPGSNIVRTGLHGSGSVDSVKIKWWELKGGII